MRGVTSSRNAIRENESLGPGRSGAVAAAAAAAAVAAPFQQRQQLRNTRPDRTGEHEGKNSRDKEAGSGRCGARAKGGGERSQDEGSEASDRRAQRGGPRGATGRLQLPARARGCTRPRPAPLPGGARPSDAKSRGPRQPAARALTAGSSVMAAAEAKNPGGGPAAASHGHRHLSNRLRKPLRVWGLRERAGAVRDTRRGPRSMRKTLTQ